MTNPSSKPITQLLAEVSQGDAAAHEKLWSVQRQDMAARTEGRRLAALVEQAVLAAATAIATPSAPQKPNRSFFHWRT